jgi:hypothetical protein
MSTYSYGSQLQPTLPPTEFIIDVTANAATLITDASEVTPNHSKLTQDSIFDYYEDDFYDDSYDSPTSRNDILALAYQAQLITTADNTNDSSHHLHFSPWSITTPRKAYSSGYSSAQVEDRSAYGRRL